MYKKTKIKRLTIFLFLSFFILTQSIYAETETIGIDVNDRAEMVEVIESVAVKLGAEPGATKVELKAKDGETNKVVVFEMSDVDEVLKFNSSNFLNSESKDRRQLLKLFVEELSNSNVSANTQSYVMNRIQESDNQIASMMIPLIADTGKADLFGAFKILQPFTGPFGVLLGLGAYLIIALVMLSTLFDFVYIGLPVWREKSAEKNPDKSKPFGVSYEALTTVKDVESGLSENGGAYKNAYLLYLKRRSLTYIVLSIAILYLVSGQISAVIAFFMDMVSGTL